MDVRVGLWRKLRAEELILLNVVLGKTLESPLDCKDLQPVHPKGYQSWVFIGRTDVEAETPILWPPHVKSWLTGKDTDARLRAGGEGDDRGWDGWWHHWLNGHGFVGGLRELVMDRKAWRAVVHGVTKSRTWLSDWSELNWTDIRPKSNLEAIQILVWPYLYFSLQVYGNEKTIPHVNYYSL